MHHSRPIAFLKYFLIFLSITFPFLVCTQSLAKNTLTDYIIVVDAGHGGKDIGSSGAHLIEKDVTFSLAEEIAASIIRRNREIDIRFTRTDDDFIPIHERVSFANDANADLFISIHCNGISSKQPHGIETYVLGTQDHHENLETVKRENASILHESDFKNRYNGFDPNSPSAHIYFSAVQNQYINEGILLAHEIQTGFSDRAIMRDRGVKQAGFVVLRKATMPAILIEVGYLSNTSDEKKLMNNAQRKIIVDKIADGILKYVADHPKRQVVANVDNLKEETKVVNVSTQASKKSNEEKTPEPLFTILIGSSAKGRIENLYKGKILDQNVREAIISNLHEYHVGIFNSLKDALDFQNQIRDMGYKGAFVKKYLEPSKSNKSSSDVQLKFAGVN